MKERSLTPPECLYKYYSAFGIENVIAHNTLRWTVPCEENDPFEASARGWDLEAVKENCPNILPDQISILDGIFDAGTIQKRVSHVTSFVSFSEDPTNILMWAHYAENHSGVCLEFATSCIRGIDSIKRVTYANPNEGVDRFPLPSATNEETSHRYLMKVRGFLSKKAHVWAYEKEWRLIVPPMAEIIECKKIDNKYILVSHIPQGAVTKMIFGYRVPVSTRIAWAKGIRKNHCNCRFAEVVPDEKRYELTVEPLEMDVIEKSTLPDSGCHVNSSNHSSQINEGA